MIAQFRNIDYSKMLYETLRNYYSINANNQPSWLYIYLSCIIQPMQLPFNAYQTFRTLEALIAQCKWQIGQLTNVLNMIFDASLKRIFITQNTLLIIADPTFPYPPDHQDSDFGTAPKIQERGFFDRSAETIVTINVPIGIDQSAITAVVEQIRMQGIPYSIVFF